MTETERTAGALDVIAHRYHIHGEDDDVLRDAAALLRAEPVGPLEMRSVEGGYVFRLGNAALPEVLTADEVMSRLRAEPVGEPVAVITVNRDQDGMLWIGSERLPAANDLPVGTHRLYAAPPAAPEAQEPNDGASLAMTPEELEAWIAKPKAWRTTPILPPSRETLPHSEAQEPERVLGMTVLLDPTMPADEIRMGDGTPHGSCVIKNVVPPTSAAGEEER